MFFVHRIIVKQKNIILMKKSTRPTLFLTALSLFATCSIHAQMPLLKDLLESEKHRSPAPAASVSQPILIPEGGMPVTGLSAGKTTQMNCTDKINYVGDTPGSFYIQAGGTNTNVVREICLLQTYPAYTGSVTAVEIYAIKPSSLATNPVVAIGIFPLFPNGVPDLMTQTPSPIPVITVTSSALSIYTLTFSSPVPVSNGFAIGIYTGSQDSVGIIAGPVLSSNPPFYSYILTSQAQTLTLNNHLSINMNLLMKPIVTTSVNPGLLAIQSSTSCEVPVVYNFTNTSASSPSYVGHPVINPLGVTRTLNFGDASPAVSNFSVGSTATHSYTSHGNYIANYTETYNGWINSCTESKTVQVSVMAPIPAFSYTVNGMTVQLLENSNPTYSLSNFTWNFGDLSTSNQQQPGSHTYSSPGTYFIELEATAPCGKVRYSVSVNISTTTGIDRHLLDDAHISLFPNPSDRLLNIVYSGGKQLNARIEVYNQLGHILKTGEADFSSGQAEVDVSGLAKGLYFIRIRSDQGTLSRSFIKE